MRLLGLFSGTKSISKEAKSLVWETINLDIDPTYLDENDICEDIRFFDDSKRLP